MPNQPYLDSEKTLVDGLAFIGLSFTRNSKEGHPDSITHQESFDLNEVLDRDYEFLSSSNDDGWLVGGGEPGPPTSYKLAAKDSSHVEIMRIGTYRPDWGGITEKEIVDVLNSGRILIPQMEVVPTAVVANPDTPPELEIRFDMDPPVPDFENLEAPLPVNWAIRFVHNQLFKHFVFPSRFCPGPFHSTILRKACFRTEAHKDAYFAKCEAAIKRWRVHGPKPLNTGGWGVDGTPMKDAGEYNSGLWLFQDRDNITHFFKPNFLPPYNDPEKRKIILKYLSEEWDEHELKWKSVVPSSLENRDFAIKEAESTEEGKKVGLGSLGDMDTAPVSRGKKIEFDSLGDMGKAPEFEEEKKEDMETDTVFGKKQVELV